MYLYLFIYLYLLIFIYVCFIFDILTIIHFWKLKARIKKGSVHCVALCLVCGFY